MTGINQLRLTATRPRVALPFPVMFDIRAVLVGTFFILLAGCGSSTNTPVPAPPPIAAKPDVTITIDGERHACVVALASEAQGSAIVCSDVVPFVRDELRLPSGSIYDIRAIPDLNQAEMAKVEEKLKAAGYRFIGGPHKDR